ncbi:MAG: hypothetical protein EA359_12330 [Balneolaceae bacterium]|nr:MAG: hypothetical protein EA359_12330 [Balneolaceae bacterium]
MSRELTVLEKYSRYWPQIVVLSFLMTLIFFISYLAATDLLLEGYLRLAAFGFFALTVLSFFKMKEGQILIKIEITDDKVAVIQYFLRNRLIKEEEWGLTELHSIKVDEMPNKTLYNDILKSDRCLKFRRKDENNWIYLNKVYRKVVPLSEENALQVYHFLINAKKHFA